MKEGEMSASQEFLEGIRRIDQAIIKSRRVIECPESYFTQPTPGEKACAERKLHLYNNSIKAGLTKIPPSIDTASGMINFIEDDEAYLVLVSESEYIREITAGFVNPVTKKFAQEREEAIGKLMNLSPLDVAELKAKAAKLNQPQVVNY
jgi:hypothetical protein